MQIKKLTINNSRNLDGQNSSLTDVCNYIVGYDCNKKLKENKRLFLHTDNLKIALV